MRDEIAGPDDWSAPFVLSVCIDDRELFPTGVRVETHNSFDDLVADAAYLASEFKGVDGNAILHAGEMKDARELREAMDAAFGDGRWSVFHRVGGYLGDEPARWPGSVRASEKSRAAWLLEKLALIRMRVRHSQEGSDRKWDLGAAHAYEEWLDSLAPLELTPEQRSRYATILEEL